MQEIDLPAAQPISGRRRMVTAAVLILLVGPALAFAGFQLLAPASTRAGLIFLLGFEPWRLTSITPLASGGFLIEEQFNPSWARHGGSSTSRSRPGSNEAMSSSSWA